MPLSDVKLRALKPRDKPYKVSDGGGLHVLVTPAGGRLWRLSYRHDGKQKGQALGKYPNVGLAEARAERERAKTLLAKGEDPKRKPIDDIDLSSAGSFRTMAEEWFALRAPRWAESYASRVRSRFEADIYPVIGDLPIEGLRSIDVLSAIRKVEDRGAVEMASRLLQHCGAIFRYAIATGRCRTGDPTYGLRTALSSREHPKQRKFLGANDLPEFLAKLRDYQGNASTLLGLRLLLLTVVRSGELRFARWDEFHDLEGSEPLWRISAWRMKMRRDHVIPLPTQAVQVLRELRPHCYGPLLFPSNTVSGVMSENTLIYAMYRMGYHGRATVHGFRSTFSTIANETCEFNSDWIERQLAHVGKNEVRNAYNAAEYLTQRRRMMTWWADYLDRQTAV